MRYCKGNNLIVFDLNFSKNRHPICKREDLYEVRSLFDDDAREYVITTPRTPLPWINYLGSEAFFSLVSHTAGGYSFYKDAKLRRITRYRYNNVPAGF